MEFGSEIMKSHDLKKALFKGCVGRWIQDRQELILGGIPYAGIQDNVRHGDGDFIWKRNHTHTAVSWQG